jgi:sugar lactone lactonase YvrE
MSSKSAGTLWFSLALAVVLVPLSVGAASNDTAINPKSFYPEGPIVVGHTLYYAEMGSDRVMRWDGKTNAEVWHRPGCGPTSVARGGEGSLVVLCHEQNAVARVSASGKTLKMIDRDSKGLPFMDPNASINDSRGGVYFSSSGLFSPSAPAQGAVLYLDAKDRLTRLAEGIHYSNGVALSPDGKTLFVSEHLSRRILAFDVGSSGELANRRVFVALDEIEPAQADRGWEVGPDGLAIDREGNLYIAEYGAGHLLVVDPHAKLLATLPVGEPYVTAATFGASEDRIFVTAPASFADPSDPGKVYSLKNPAYRPD